MDLGLRVPFFFFLGGGGGDFEAQLRSPKPDKTGFRVSDRVSLCSYVASTFIPYYPPEPSCNQNAEDSIVPRPQALSLFRR